MIELVSLVADRSIEAAVDAVLRRPEALGTRAFTWEIVVHPGRDPGCFHHPDELLSGYTDRAQHALVVFDRDWDGAPPGDARALEAMVEPGLDALRADWARAVVIDPELEVWVFGESPHVAGVLGWSTSTPELRRALEDEGLWDPTSAKPGDPKRAMDWALRRARQPRSSSLFRELGARVSLQRCQDRSFRRLVAIVSQWFGTGQEA